MTLLHSNFFSLSKQSPLSNAINFGDKICSYGTLSSKALNLAGLLKSFGLSRNDRVCIFGAKSEALYVSILAILAAGGTFIPLDQSYPEERLVDIVRQAKPKFIINCSDIKVNLPASSFNYDELMQMDLPSVDEYNHSIPLPTDIAYILFTSGSTGIPKGVMVSHRNALAFISWACEYFDISSDDRISGHSDVSFDLAIFDIFVSLSTGACLFPVTEMFDKIAPGDFIEKNELTVWFSVPSVVTGMSLYKQIESKKMSSLRWMAFCGEPLRPGVVQSIRGVRSDLKIANLYGPTEATVACAAYQIDKIFKKNELGVSIGRKTSGTEIFVWHPEGRIANNGEEGEVYIAGDQVSPGYFQSPEQTAERFIEDPRFIGTLTKCFKTGDIAIKTSDGVFFKSRIDNQIKFRGFRIELGDVEQAIARINSVSEVATMLVKGENGEDDRFFAFVSTIEPLQTSEILKNLKRFLPQYMLPTHIKIVSDFPRTSNQKIDRSRLHLLL